MREAHKRKGENRNAGQLQKDSDGLLSRLKEEHVRSLEEQLVGRKEEKLGV